MTKQNYIPQEIAKYVWFVAAGELAHTDDMPDEYMGLFETARKAAKEAYDEKQQELKKLINPED